MPLLTDEEVLDRITTDVGADPLDTVFSALLGVLYDSFSGYSDYDPSGDLRYYATLRAACDLMLGKAAPSVNQSDGAGGSISAGDWFTHLEEIRRQADLDFAARVKAVNASSAALNTVMLNTELSTPPYGWPDPASPIYSGDPNYRNRMGGRGW